MRYIAFLRGINVGGVKIKMPDLKADFEQHGFSDVQTVLATGNVIFSCDKVPDLSFLPVKVFLFDEKKVRQIFARNPLEIKEKTHTYVFIAEPDFAEVALAEFENLKTEEESAALAKNVFYWQVPIGKTLDTPFGKILGKKLYKELFTSRNINTLERIINKL